ncbi:MAG TPA: ELM1/GtrOC1 family putative glycosyltransferase [Dongiaceae bacterium]
MMVTAGPPSATAPAAPAILAIDLAASGGAWPTGKVESVIAANLLERVPAEDVPWTVEKIFASAQRSVAVHVDSGNGSTVRAAEWWHEHFRRTAARFPGIPWYLELNGSGVDSDSAVFLNDGPRQFKSKQPLVWVLLGQRAGDRAQLLALAEALGWPYEIKDLQYTGRHYLPNLLQSVTTLSLDPTSAAQLLAPWPDIVIDCGKRSVPIARWIKKQSGGRTWLVHLGRPWGRFEWFDLIVTTPQYRIPPRPNVQVNAVPVNRRAQGDIDEEAAHWRDRFATLSRPWIGLIVGGRAPPYELDAAAARRLGELASDLALKTGGSLLVTTSPRTSSSAADALSAAIRAPAFFHRWAAVSTENPYAAILGLADQFIVTGESASMLAEACGTGRPVAIFDLPRRPGPVTWMNDALERLAFGHGGRASYRGTPQQQDWLARTYDRLVERGLFMPLRDFRAYQETLIARGWAHRLGESTPSLPRQPQQDLERTVARIQRLVMSDGRRL